jgi:membrane protein YqaA with SNARE-associated domain
MLTALYDITIRWANHPKATIFLAILSFAESSFIPIPPDVMLAPMSMAKPKSAWYYAFIATLFSVIGGIFGYFLGYFLFESLMQPFIIKFGYLASYQNVLVWFNKWGFIAVLLAGATPIPYKMFTIGAGVLKFNLLGFIMASILGRGARFFLVSGLMKFQGNNIDSFCRKLLTKHTKKLIIALILVSLIFIIFNKL